MAPIIGDRIVLRLLREDDLPIVLAWRNADRNRVRFTYSEPIAWEQHVAWYQRYLERDDDFVWVFEQREPPEPVGQFSLYNVDWPNRRAECGRLLIGKLALRGLGYAEEGVRLCLRHAVEVMGLHEIYCFIQRTNRSSIAVALATGFFVDTLDGEMVRLVFRSGG